MTKLNEATSNGVYSLKNGWLKTPVKDDIPDNVDLEPELSEFRQRAAECQTIEEVDNFIDDIYKLRQESILTDGEYGKGNLVFKELRNDGTLQRLKDKKVELENDEMSLEDMNEALSPVPKGTTIVQTKKFERDFKKLGLNDDDLVDLEESITTYPPNASLGSSIYKFRWSPKSFAKGKSGATRVIYILKSNKGYVYLALIYSKNEKEDIDNNELEGLKALSKAFNGR